MKRLQTVYRSQIGSLYLVASEKGLQGIHWVRQEVPLVQSLLGLNRIENILLMATRQLDEYFKGIRKKFSVPIDMVGTPFQKKVWEQLLEIPYGMCISYKDLASKIKKPKAFRAVGTANGKNPLSLVVPCHRVIASDGTIGGYLGGVETKRRLLELEANTRGSRLQ